jgi:hypothetical protein
MSAASTLTIEPYRRFWALRDGAELIAIVVYKKGAKNVRRVIEDERAEKERRS